jgi:L-seryl-tRNA(Ser) seleniumtransferase
MTRTLGYSDLELDLPTGRRGNRNQGVSQLLALVCGTEAGLAVNNNAAAVLLVARALARGGEVLISRGELVEIGGSFRIPEVIESAGARLREVGTTNRTHLKDYRRAAGPDTRAIFKIHTSNFRVEGFTKSPTRGELAALARELKVPLVEDLGSGCLFSVKDLGMGEEPTPEEVLRQGVDLVTFSGDKLLGGVQAGLVAGSQELVARLAADPLMRALRLDKLMTAGLQATLASYLQEDGLGKQLPLYQALMRTPEQLREDCEWFLVGLSDLLPDLEVVASEAPVGGGSCPGESLPGFSLAISASGGKPDSLARRLRTGEIPLLLRIEKDRLLLDPRCLLGEGERRLAMEALRTAFGGP